MSPQKYKIRFYALQALGLAAMDLGIHTYIHTYTNININVLSDIYGKPSKSDPYLKISLGKNKFNDRENAVDDVTNVVRTYKILFITKIHTYIHTYFQTF